MRGLWVVAAMALAAPAIASEGAAPAPAEEATTSPGDAPAVEVVPVAAEARRAETPDASEEPTGPRPRLRWVELAEALARARNPARRADLFASTPPPLVVTDGFGLLVQRRFGR
jgi:hypothetical protein